MLTSPWFLLAAGLVLLLGGGDALVRGSVAAATRLGVSRLLIGLTLVGFGTSMPELAASLKGALAGSPGVAAGNVVGSNIANVLLILGVSAVILPIATRRQSVVRDGSVMIAASLLFLAVVLTGYLGRAAGAAFVATLAGYTVFAYFSERDTAADTETALLPPARKGLLPALLLAAAGVAGVVAGASLLVGSAIEIAAAAGLSEAVIGLTLVAVGTSLPELVTSVMAAVRRQGDLAFGNVVGSNVFNILGIAGVTALVQPLQIPAQIAGLDIWVMIAAAALLVMFAVSGWRISRREGMVFLLAYAAYIAVLLRPGLFGLAGPA